MDLVRLERIDVKVTDAHEGESLAHYPLQDGDGVVADRGYNSARALIECADRGVAVVVRYNPHSEHFRKLDGQMLVGGGAL